MLHLKRGIVACLTLACVMAWSGCVKPQRAKVSTPVTPPPLVATRPSVLFAKPAVDARLHTVGTLLEQLITDPANAIPDAILNRTTCFVVFPRVGETNGPTAGFASCRNSSELWTSPAAAILSETSSEMHGDLLVFLLSDRARHELIQGQLKFGPELSAVPGPLVRERSTLDQVELGTDAFGYLRSADAFHGEAVNNGSIALNAPETSKLYGHGMNPRILLDNSTVSSTVTSFFNLDIGSFFNTITPVGIIIHHSVLTASHSGIGAEDVLEQFHSGRGYEISCFGKTYHIAYHYLILRDGQVRPGRPERCEGAHARGYNSYLGIALVGDFSSVDNPRGKRGPTSPTKAQMRSLIRLCRALREKYNIPLQRIMPHSAVARTECPGDRLQFTRILAALEDKTSSGL